MREFSRVLSLLFSVLAVIYWLMIGDPAARFVAAIVGLISLTLQWWLVRASQTPE